MTPVEERCPRCQTVLCDTAHGSRVCPRCELAGALGEGAAADLVYAGAFGNYEVESLIAHGGMGAVYRARHRGTGRTVALKTLLTGRLANPEMRERFLREARLAAKLRHPHIVPLLEVGEAEGLPFIAMEFVPGKNLADTLRDGPLPPKRAALLLEKIAGAVAHAHKQGVLHRDLKPANILLDETGEPRVADFGLAKPVDLTTELTVTGQIFGSPGYLAPERVPQETDAGTKNGEAEGVTSDVYSLGATLYHLLTGRPPFQGATFHAVLMQVVNTEPIGPRKLNPSVPPALEAICLKCLEKEPHCRYASAKELAEDLQRFLKDQPVRARLPGLAARSWRWCRRRPVVAGLAGAVIILALAVVTVSVAAALRAQRDEARLRMQLAGSLLAQARAQNRGDLAGKRDAALAAIHKAADIQPTLALRNEAIAALAQPDFRVVGESRMPQTQGVLDYGIDPSGRYYFFALDGKLAFERTIDGKIEFTIDCPTGLPTATRDTVFGGLDNRWLLAETPSNSVAVWDLHRRKLAWFSSLQTKLRPVATPLPNNDELLFSADGLNLLHVDLISGTITRTSTLPARVKGLWCSPDGNYIAVASGSNFWINSGLAATWKGPWQTPREISLGRFDPTSSKLVWSLTDNSFCLWDLAGDYERGRLVGHSGFATGGAFEPSGRWMATCSHDGTTRLWDLLTAEQQNIAPMAGNRILWHNSSQSFSLRQYGSQGLAWLEFQRPADSLALVPRFSNREAELCPISLNANGRVAVVTAADYVNLLDTRTGQILMRLGVARYGRVIAQFEPKDRGLICGTVADLVRWPMRWVGDELIELGPKEIIRGGFPSQSLAFDRMGERLAVSRPDGLIRLRDPAGNWQRITNSAGGLEVALSPDGRWLAGGAFNQDWLRVWDTSSGELRHEFKTAKSVNPGFTPDGRLFSISSRELAFWNLETGTREKSLARSTTDPLRGKAVFSADGQFMAFSRSRTRVDLLYAPTLEVLATFDVIDNDANVLALDEHGTQLIIGKKHQYLERWDLRKLRAELTKLNLDWNLPPLPAEEPVAGKSLRVVVKE